MTVPQSLLVAALALAWLIVLVPMVSRKGRTVEESVEGRGFRVLQRSGSATKMSRLRRRSTVAASVADDSAGSDDADVDDSDRDDSEQTDTSVLAEYPQTEAAKRWLAAQVRNGRTTGEREKEMNEDNISTEDSSATSEIAVVKVADDHLTDGHTETDSIADDYSDEYTAEYVSDEYVSDDNVSDGYVADEYTETAYEETTYDDRSREDAPVSHENHRRQGRGGFDPEASETARRFRYAKRQRVALILLVLTVVFGGAAVALTPSLWIGAGVTGLLLVAYLTYLRRQVRIEEEIRQRRSARLQRARQIRPERYSDEAVEYSHAPVYAADAYPVSQIPGPAHDRRGRVVVDLEDDDPGFDDLAQYEPIVYKRASGQ